jgi:hypothetical protein
MRRSPIRKANPKRKRERFRDSYYSQQYLLEIQALGCLVCRQTPSEAAHVVSRGAGGTWSDLVPLCRDHHREQHTDGIRTFADRHGIDLRDAAATVAAELAHVRKEEDR